MDRRSFLLSSLAAGGALALPSLAQASTTYSASNPLKIGFCYPGPIGDVGWTFQHELGRRLVDKTFGNRVKTMYIENVPETADAERVIRQFIQQGCNMVFTTSFGFMEPTLRVAKLFPKVTFEHATGYKTAPNMGIYQTRFYEGAYLLGILAGKMTKTNTLGFVASVPIPEVLRNINAFTLGARSVNPKIQTKVIWVYSWYDPGREREAAETLVAQGADVMYQNTDSPAIVQVAQDKGLFAFGQDSDMLKYGPKSHLSANTVNWGVYYVKKVQEVLDGKWEQEDTKWGMKEGMIELSPLNAAVPADVAKLFNQKKADIVAGKFNPFSGEIRDNEGKVRVAAGQVLPESELWSLKWYAEGVQGKVPS
ncbi:BMP family ABC transporter substrate-binding protein [Uliginosibacterium sp. H1]|uniref:BMP family ABC transporter substrate-binding protein n=1 Tax=Uliginosibacterium sp. H1 TaxID=3114757 RepID=UPI002E17ADCF|nr:BMP family ABC transporter substrate-binding protein [Uliginosibacterium sp. H1]